MLVLIDLYLVAHTACPCIMNMWTTYRDIGIHIHKYSDFLVVMISVGLATARPNYSLASQTPLLNSREKVRSAAHVPCVAMHCTVHIKFAVM